MATTGKRYATRENSRARASSRKNHAASPKNKTSDINTKLKKRNKKVLVSRIKVISVAFALVLLVVGSILAIRAAMPTIQDTTEKASYPLKYEKIIDKNVKEFGLDKSLVCAVIYAESFYNPDAQSSAGAYGLMQLTEETFNWMQERTDGKITYTSDDLTDPEINVHYGCALLKLLNDYYSGNIKLMLCGYNAGIGSTDSWLSEYPDGNGGISYIPYSETESYVVIVTEAMEKYTSIYDL